MKKIILGLISTTLISGCSTLPSSPTPHVQKHTVQILELDIPVPDSLTFIWTVVGNQISVSSINQEVEEAIQDPDTKIHEYPLLYAEMGVPLTLDQTTTASFVDDFTVMNGKASTVKKPHQIGTFIELTLTDATNGVVSCEINLRTKKLKGYEPNHVAGAKVKIPFFTEKQIKTKMLVSLDSWTSLGAIEGTLDGKKGKFRKQFAIKIIPPSNTE